MLLFALLLSVASLVLGRTNQTNGTSGVTAKTSSTFNTPGIPFNALPVDGRLIISESANKTQNTSGLAVYTLGSNGNLSLNCFQNVSFNGSNTIFGFAKTLNSSGFVVAIEDAGIATLPYNQTIANCSATAVQISQGSAASAQGSFDVSLTPDGRYAFVANEYGVVANDSNGIPIRGNVGVVSLQYDSTAQLSGGSLLGQIGLGGAAVAGVTVSHDGQRVYATTEVLANGTIVSASNDSRIAHGGCLQQVGGKPQTYGSLSVINVSQAVTSPGRSAIIASVAAGCSPVRIAESSDGQTVWVTARGDNNILAYSVSALLSTPNNSLVGYTSSGGIAPVGLALFAQDKLLAVTNSNRFAAAATPGNLTILSALPSAPQIVASVNASLFPRSVNVGSDNTTLYLVDYSSSQVQIIETSGTS